MESYYNATASYKQIKEAEYSWDYYGEYDSMNKSVVSTIVFSAMAIEAFINDYAAACLGDLDFYDNFDKLSLSVSLINFDVPKIKLYEILIPA